MLDTTRAMGVRELSLTAPATCNAASPSSAVESEGTEFFDAYDTLPWSPERAGPTRQSPAAVAARRMQLALWPDTDESAAEKPHKEWDVLTGIGINNGGNGGIATSSPPSAGVEALEVGGRGGVAGLAK